MEALLNFLTQLFELLRALGVYIQNEPIQAVLILLALAVAVVVLRVAFSISLKIAVTVVILVAIFGGGAVFWQYGSSMIKELTEDSGNDAFWEDEFLEVLRSAHENEYHAELHRGSSLLQRVSSGLGDGDPLDIPETATYESGIEMLREFSEEDTREIAYFFIVDTDGDTRWQFGAVGAEGSAMVRSMDFDWMTGKEELARVYFIHTHPQQLSSSRMLPPSGADVLSGVFLLSTIESLPRLGEFEFIPQVVDGSSLWTYQVEGARRLIEEKRTESGSAGVTVWLEEWLAELYTHEQVYLCELAGSCVGITDANRTQAAESLVSVLERIGAEVTREVIGSDL